MTPESTIKETRGTLDVEVFSHSPLAEPGEMIGWAKGPCRGCEEITEGDYAEDDEDDWWCGQCWAVEEKVRLKARVKELEAEVASLKTHTKHLEWYRGQDSGISSETIFQVMTGIPVKWTSTPMDSGDFGRCHRMLKLFPEWHSRLCEVSEQFPEWKQLIDNWSRLEVLYEKEKHNEVYELIKRCCNHV